MKNVFLLKGYKTTFLTFLWSVLLSIGVSFQGQAQNIITVPFNEGFVGINSANNVASSCYYMTSLGFSTIQFAQNSPAAIFTAQGNDIIGYAYITDNNGVGHQIPGFIKWRTTQGSTVKSIVFQPGATVFNLATNGSNGAATYTINGSSYIGLTFNGQTEVIPTTGGNAYEVSGNAATAGLLDALNLYLGSFPSISATNVTVSESAGNATITLTLSASSSNTVTVHYETADSTATQPSDYTLSSGTVTFNPGETTKTITIPIINDVINESQEFLKVLLHDPVNASIANALRLITINDNDTPPSPPSISAIADQTGCGSFGPLSFTIGDAETSAANLTLSASAVNTTLFPSSGITFGGSGANRTISLVAASGLTGSSDINVVVTDENGEEAYISFMVTVDFAISAGLDQAICSGSNANLTATATDNTTGGTFLTTFNVNSLLF
jgi:hypothetical protein